MPRRAGAILVAALALLVLLVGAGGARAEGVPPATGAVPAEGEWLGVTSGGLPVGFTVGGGGISNLHFGFNAAGLCGVGEATEAYAPKPPTLNADGSWGFTYDLGQFIQGVFVSPERAEGRIVSPGREFPNCPYTETNFAAELGHVPTYVQPQLFAIERLGKERHALRPREIRVSRRLSFFPLKWKRFGEPSTRAKAFADYQGRGHVYQVPVTVSLSRPVVQPGGYEVYAKLTYTLHGPIPHAVPLHRSGAFRMI
jgi:hypothetical protein